MGAGGGWGGIKGGGGGVKGGGGGTKGGGVKGGGDGTKGGGGGVKGGGDGTKGGGVKGGGDGTKGGGVMGGGDGTKGGGGGVKGGGDGTKGGGGGVKGGGDGTKGGGVKGGGDGTKGGGGGVKGGGGGTKGGGGGVKGGGDGTKGGGGGTKGGGGGTKGGGGGTKGGGGGNAKPKPNPPKPPKPKRTTTETSTTETTTPEPITTEPSTTETTTPEPTTTEPPTDEPDTSESPSECTTRDSGIKGSSRWPDGQQQQQQQDIDPWGTEGGAAGAGVPVHMAANVEEDDEDDKEDDDQRTESRRNERAPLVCFLRGEGFERKGVQKFTLRSLPLAKCTHIVYSFLETDNNTGEFIYRKRGNKGEKKILDDLTRVKLNSRGKHVNTLVSYGSGAHVQSLLNRIRDGKKLDQLVRHIKNTLRWLGLDGINFHLEGPGPAPCKQEDVMTILKFIKTLRRELKKGVFITAQLPACRDPKCNIFMSEKMARSLDYLFLMTYDYKLDDLSKTKLTSGLYHYKDQHGPTKIETETCVGQWSDAGVPKYKLVPGIATYGRSFTLEKPEFNGVSAKLNDKHPLGNAANMTNTDGYMNYVETCQRASYMGWTREWVKYAATPYIYHKNQWVSYDDKDSADVKVRWYRDRWLGGVFIWSLDEDDYSGKCKQGERYPMVNTAFNVMKDYRPVRVHLPWN
ncbi:chitinase-3-like protein 1 [Amblyomma americanum]